MRRGRQGEEAGAGRGFMKGGGRGAPGPGVAGPAPAPAGCMQCDTPGVPVNTTGHVGWADDCGRRACGGCQACIAIIVSLIHRDRVQLQLQFQVFS